MERGVTAIERAFEIARSGTCTTVEDIRKQLRAEGYDRDQIFGRELLRQLRTLITEARDNQLP